MTDDVRLLLSQARLSQGAVARATGLSRSYLSLIMSGNRPAPDWFIRELWKLLRGREVTITQGELRSMLASTGGGAE